MIFFKYCILLLTVFVFTHCQTFRLQTRPHTAQIIREGWIDCFEPDPNGSEIWCEASAILAQRGQLFLANDKDMPAPRSAMFRINGIPGKSATGHHAQPVYSEHSLLRAAHTFEEFAVSPDQQWVFLITAFDRFTSGSSEQNGYNMLLAWQVGREDSPELLGTNGNSGVSSALRCQLQQALGNPAYFKVEGLAVTNDRLWFGVREQGDNHAVYDHKITILSAPYHIEPSLRAGAAVNAKQVMLGPVVTIRDFTVGTVDPSLPKLLAISSLEYDPVRRCFWVLTSFEEGDKLGAYLWTITENDLLNKGNLQLVRTATGKPLTFSHKAEDMTFTDANTLLLIHDDDHVRTHIGNQQRRPNQAAYSVVKIN
ncbi:hypothetical protein [Fibrella aquatilis]|uniref:Uncharacterized protein n=1 Tax=Fibrella aquatilis TaxID=2817059 RepID=A0A939GE95_9BACT|nr:hypothetical protein [Fibrella aquatilis]MBO0934818.1 hypothetical protein [Fibrella aquatilis]